MKKEYAWILIALIILPCVSASSVVRTFRAGAVGPGEEIEVNITLQLTNGETTAIISEVYPTGWEVTYPGDAQDNNGTLEWMFTEGTGNAQAKQGVHTYRIRAPLSEGPYTFYGTYYLGPPGISNMTTPADIEGQSFVSVITNPPMDPQGDGNPTGCQEQWMPSEEWTACADGKRERIYTDINACGTVLLKPAPEIQDCGEKINSPATGDIFFIVFFAIAIPLLLILVIVLIVRSSAKKNAAHNVPPVKSQGDEQKKESVETSNQETVQGDTENMKNLVQTYLKSGYSRGDIEAALRQKGWPEKDIAQFFAN